MHAITTITDRLTLVMLSISIWSGRKKLRPEDLNLGSGEIPPEDLVSLGSKRVCDPESLKAFYRLKQSAERACLRVGTRFLGGFAVPHEQAEALADQLTALKARVRRLRPSPFLADYDQALEAWIASLPQWEEPIRRAIEPASVVGGRLRFGYQLIHVSPAEQPGTLEEEVQRLGQRDLRRGRPDGQRTGGSFEGKAKLHRRALAPSHGFARSSPACPSSTPGFSLSWTPSMTGWGGCPRLAPSLEPSSMKAWGWPCCSLTQSAWPGMEADSWRFATAQHLLRQTPMRMPTTRTPSSTSWRSCSPTLNRRL